MTGYTQPPVAQKHEPLDFPEGAFPVALLALRKASDLSQIAAARALGLRKQGTVSDWERGETCPHPLVQRDAIAKLRRLAKKAKPAG